MAILLQEVRLEAASVRSAWYCLRLLALQDGFVIEKRSGGGKANGVAEAWFRWHMADAEKLFRRILSEKTRPGRKRAYKLAQPQLSTQMSLF